MECWFITARVDKDRDLSSLFMFESTGDSETDIDPNALASGEIRNDLADEDAESCSWEPFDDSACAANCFGDQTHHSDDDGEVDLHQGFNDVNGGCAWGGMVQERSCGSGSSTSVCFNVVVDEEVTSSSKDRRAAAGGSDAIGDLKDEMEKSRIFWETCLAVGYP